MTAYNPSSSNKMTVVSPQSTMQTHQQRQQQHDEYVAIVLATTSGRRLEPITSSNTNEDGLAKHLLPVAGVPSIVRLVYSIEQAGFNHCIVAIAKQDKTQTLNALLQQSEVVRLQPKPITDTEKATLTTKSSDIIMDTNTIPNSDDEEDDNDNDTITTLVYNNHMKITLFRVQSPRSMSTVSIDETKGDSTKKKKKKSSKNDERLLSGSNEVIKQIVQATDHNDINLVSPISNLVLFPGDLIVFDPTTLSNMIHTHRSSVNYRKSNSIRNNNNIMMLLVDVGEQDEHGIPLKESAKLKKGVGLAIDEDDIEYIAIASDNNNTSSHRQVVWKQSLVEVEEDKYMDGSTPKVCLPKSKLHMSASTTTTIRTDWVDVHVYIIPPWIYNTNTKLFHYKSNIKSVQKDLLPLLISRQSKGILKTISSKSFDTKVQQEIQNDLYKLQLQQQSEFPLLSSVQQMEIGKSNILTNAVSTNNMLSTTPVSGAAGSSTTEDNIGYDNTYSVLAYIIPDKTSITVRASTITSYLYLNKEIAHQISAASYLVSTVTTSLPDKVVLNRRLQNLFLPRGSVIKSKFHSVLAADNDSTTVTNDGATTVATIGDKVTYKSIIVGPRCTIGTKCRLNNVILLSNVQMGDNCVIQNTIIGSNVTIGPNCSLNDCQIATNVTIPAGTKLKGENITK